MEDHSSSSNLNVTSADEPPARASAATLSSAAIGGPLTHTHAVTITADEQPASRTLFSNSSASLASSLASGASPLSVSERTAAAAALPAVDSACAAAAESDAGPSTSSAAALSSSSDGRSQRQPQSKKHRGGSAQAGRSQAHAAVAAGVDPMRADPINAAVSSASSGDGHRSSAVCMTDVPSSSSALTHERKEASQAAGSAVSIGLVAAAAEPSGSSAPHTRPCLFDDGAILQLVVEGISLAESELHLLEQRPWVAQRKRQLAEAKAHMRAIHALPAAQQLVFQEDRRYLAGEIVSCERALDNHARFVSSIRITVGGARAATTEPAAVPLRALGSLCVEMRKFVAQMLPTDPPRGLRAWMQRVDLLFTQIAHRLPQLALTSDECCDLLFAAMDAGALQLVPALMQQGNMRAGCGAFDLVSLCLDPTRHFVSHQPYLRLFRYGLDPTRIYEDRSPLSALQLARNFIRDHPAPVEAATVTELAAMVPAAASSSSGPADPDPIPSLLAAWATQQAEPTRPAEGSRRVTLHARFMHALLPAWLAHSVKVLSLLSSPSVLIPDLAAIVGRYLDLEGLPAETTERVGEEGAETEAEE